MAAEQQSSGITFDLATSDRGMRDLSRPARAYANGLLRQIQQHFHGLEVPDMATLITRMEDGSIDPAVAESIGGLVSAFLHTVETGKRPVADWTNLNVLYHHQLRGSIEFAGFVSTGEIASYFAGWDRQPSASAPPHGVCLLCPSDGSLRFVADNPNGSAEDIMGVTPDDRVLIKKPAQIWKPEDGSVTLMPEEVRAAITNFSMRRYNPQTNEIIFYDPDSYYVHFIDGDTMQRTGTEIIRPYPQIFGSTSDKFIIGDNSSFGSIDLLDRDFTNKSYSFEVSNLTVSQAVVVDDGGFVYTSGDTIWYGNLRKGLKMEMEDEKYDMAPSQGMIFAASHPDNPMLLAVAESQRARSAIRIHIFDAQTGRRVSTYDQAGFQCVFGADGQIGVVAGDGTYTVLG